MTADTSAVVAALSEWHTEHRAARAALGEVTALPAHALVEAYAVLTRLPGGLAVPAATAAEVLGARFAGAPLRLRRPGRLSLLDVLAAAGVAGGATYDGLVGLEAQANDHPLLTLDSRAATTYARLGVAYELIDA